MFKIKNILIILFVFGLFMGGQASFYALASSNQENEPVNTRINTEEQTETRSRNRRDMVEERREREERRREEAERRREAIEEQKKRRAEDNRRKEETRNEIRRIREGAKESIQNKKDELRNSLRDIGAERMERVLRIASSINENNIRHAERHLRVINRMESILSALPARIDAVAARGIDVAPIRLKLQEANKMVSDTKALITHQASVIYNIQPVSNEHISITIKKVRDQFHADIKNIREKLQESREIIRDIIRSLNNIDEEQSS